MNKSRLLGAVPDTPQPDASCASQDDPGGGFPLQGSGYNCTGSEMGHLYNEESVKPATPGLFSFVQSHYYWSSTEYAPDPVATWAVNFVSGHQDRANKYGNLYAWAVRSGDVVPIPASIWLFGSGLLGFVGMARRKA